MSMENTKFNKTHTVGEIVAEDYRKAAVFKNHNIDFVVEVVSL